MLRSLAAALALASPLGAAQQPVEGRADLGRGLVASYALDGDTIDDVTRGRAPAVAVRPAPDREGRRGGALAFDGARSTVDLGDRLEPARFTISAWVRPDASDRVMAIVSKIHNLPGHWQKNLELRLEPGGRLLLHVPSGRGWEAVQGVRAVPTGRWTHVAAVYDGRRAQLYVDGVRDGAPLAVAYAQTRVAVFLGARPEGGGRDGRTPTGPTFHYAGAMDDVRIYDRALDDGELGLLADRARPPPAPPSGPPGGPVPQPPRGREIVAWFPLDGDARDAAGPADGRLVGGPRPAADRGGDPRGALAFTGREHVDLGARTEPERLTLTAWIRPSRVERGGVILSKHASAPAPLDRYLELRLDAGGYLALEIPGGPRVQALRASRAVAAGRWTHVAATFDGGRAVLYLDGARDAEAPLAPFAPSPGAAFLGARPEPGGRRARPGNAFAGLLDDVRLYRGALPDQELRALAAERAGPGLPDDEEDATAGEERDGLLVSASRLLVRYDAALARRDGRRIERVEEQLAGELARMERRAREARAPQPIVQRIRRAAGELQGLRGRLDAPSLGRKRGALLGLSEVLWDDLARELDAAPIE